MAEVPFLGCSITLISKADVRYQGILCNIDPVEATVSLKNVRCFGTEDRRPAAESIPATSDMYGQIVFRGADIKDLQVIEKSAAPERPSLADPAIVSATKSAAAPSSSVFSRSLSSDADQPQSRQHNKSQHNNNNNNNNNNHNKGQHQRQVQQPQQPKNDALPGTGGFLRQSGSDQATPQDEFDFASSNAKFSQMMQDVNRLSVSDDSVEQPSQPAMPVVEKKYDKKSSFFDDISTHSSQREQGKQQNPSNQGGARGGMSNMRKVNQETFGSAAAQYRVGGRNPNGNPNGNPNANNHNQHNNNNSGNNQWRSHHNNGSRGGHRPQSARFNAAASE